MKSIFSLDSKLMQGLSTVGDYIILNVLFLISCLPIVTIGAAKAALFRVMFDLAEEKGYPYKRYFKTFAAEFKTATPLWLLQLLLQFFVFWELLVVTELIRNPVGNPMPLARGFLLGLLLLFVMLSMLFSSIPAQIALFSATRREYLKNALYILITQFLRCLIVGIFNLMPLLLWLLNPIFVAMLGPLWLLLYFSVTTNFAVRLFRKPFSEYIESYEDAQDAAPGDGAEKS